MTDPLRQQLQSTLGGIYAFELRDSPRLLAIMQRQKLDPERLYLQHRP